MVEVLKLGKIIFHDVTSKVIIMELVTNKKVLLPLTK